MSAEMTRANWRQMVSEAQRANDSRIREVLGQSLRQARDLGGRFTEQAGRVAGERLTAAKENIRAGELQKQGIRSASSGGAAFLVGLARGYVGDQAAKVAGVREGASLHAALERSRYFPPMTIHLIASGEASGKLDAMLERAALSQEREMETLMAALVGLFEPALILAMGGIVLLIVIAILLPIFDLNQMVK